MDTVGRKENCRICAEPIAGRYRSRPDKLEGIREEDIPSLAAYADKEANPLYPVPKLMNAKELQKLYYSVMEG